MTTSRVARSLKGGSRLDVAPVEERIFPVFGAPRVESRAGSDDKLGFLGHAAVFNQRAAIGNPLTWGFYEQCSTGCFDKTLSENPDVYFCQDHDAGRVLARTSNGTLRLSTDPVGLVTDADMAPVSYARDIAILVDRGDIRGMSFRFQTVKDEWSTETVEGQDSMGNALELEVEIRSLLEVKLIDVTVTAIPAYPQTDAAMRTAAGVAHELREMFLMVPLVAPDDEEPEEPDDEEIVEGFVDEDGNATDAPRSRQPATATAKKQSGNEPAKTTRSSAQRKRIHRQMGHEYDLLNRAGRQSTAEEA